MTSGTMNKTIILLITIALSDCAREAPTITLPNQGKIIGTYRTLLRTQRIIAYLGIPYAQPPLYELRFAPPNRAELPRWDGVRNGSKVAPDCMQLNYTGDNNLKNLSRHDELFMKLLDGLKDEPVEKEFSEDCLYLNIFVPEGLQPSEKWAVLVWFHGGDFVRGSPHDINPFQIVYKEKVIFVTVAYRLNIFGFFSSLDLSSPGNYGLMDQSAALEWVQNNIELFGGNKTNVCIFGQGAGAISVGLHLTSEWSTGLFQKVIAMSGNVLAPDTVKNQKLEMATAGKVAYNFGCIPKPTTQLLECLRRVDAVPLLNLGAPISEWKPIIDGDFVNITKPFITDEPNQMFEQGLYQRVPTLTGFTNMEDALLLNKEDTEDSGISQNEFNLMRNLIVQTDLDINVDNETCNENQHIILDAVEFFYNPVPPTTNETILREQFLDFYTDKVHGATTYKMAKIMSLEVPVFLYRFDLKPQSNATKTDIPSWVGVPHNFDLVFVFGLPFLALPGDYSKWDSSDKRVSEIIMKMWVNFAVNSNPTHSKVFINWEQFQSDKPGFLIIDRNFNMSTPDTVNYKAFEFWNNFYPKIFEIGTKCCNVTESSDVKTTFSALVIFICYLLHSFILQ